MVAACCCQAMPSLSGPPPRYFTLGQTTGKSGERRMVLTFNGKVSRACPAQSYLFPPHKIKKTPKPMDLRTAVAAVCGAAHGGQHSLILPLGRRSLVGQKCCLVP